MSDYLEKHCPELVKQIEEASAAGAEKANGGLLEFQFIPVAGTFPPIWQPQYVNRQFALSVINDQRERIGRQARYADVQQRIITAQDKLIVRQERWIHRLYWLSGIGWGLAVGFGVLWGWK